MQFNNFDWADSQIEEILIKYDELTMKIHNDTLDNDVLVLCDSCDYASNVEVAGCFPSSVSDEKTLEKISPYLNFDKK